VPEFGDDLRAAIQASHDDLLALAQRVLSSDLATKTPDEQVGQLVRATEAMLAEALDGRTDTRDFVLETAVPAYVEAGETASTVAGASVRFAVQLADLLAGRVSPEHRAATVEWVAEFYAAYTSATIEAISRR
jgi:hypothetical protein